MIEDHSKRALDELWSLEGRRAVVTGGAAGIGAATVRRLAEAGADFEGGLETGAGVFDRERVVKVFDHPVARSAGELHVPQFHELIVALLLLARSLILLC